MPFVFLALAFVSGHPSAPMATVKAMGLFLLVGIPVSGDRGGCGDRPGGGAGAGGIVALRASEIGTWKTRALAVLFACVYTLVLARAAGAIILISVPAFPFTSIGIADHLAERRHARELAEASPEAVTVAGAYGHFDDAAREYVITRPDTPLPWINYLGSEDYFGLISNTAGGYSFYRDARLRRLTRYRYNNVPADVGGRYLYLRDDDSGDVWSPSWQPVRRRGRGAIECRHGLGYTAIGSRRGGIAVETLYFVPLGETLEVWRVRVTNRRPTGASLSLFSAVEFCLWDAWDDATNFQRNLSTGEVEVDGVDDLPHDRVPRAARPLRLLRVLRAGDRRFDTQRDAFLGPYRGWDRPVVVVETGRVGRLDRARVGADAGRTTSR